MSRLAYFTTLHKILSKLYEVAYLLKHDSNYSREDAVEDLLKVIDQLKADSNVSEIEDNRADIYMK